MIVGVVEPHESSLLPAVVLVQGGDACEVGLPLRHGFAEYHEKASNHRQVAEEEVQVEDQAIAKALQDDDAKKPANSYLGVPLYHDSARGTQHCLYNCDGLMGLVVIIRSEQKLTTMLIKRKMWLIPQGKLRCLLESAGMSLTRQTQLGLSY